MAEEETLFTEVDLPEVHYIHPHVLKLNGHTPTASPNNTSPPQKVQENDRVTLDVRIFELSDLANENITFYPASVKQKLSHKTVGARQAFLQNVADIFRVRLSDELFRATLPIDVTVSAAEDGGKSGPAAQADVAAQPPLRLRRPGSHLQAHLPHYAKSSLLQYLPYVAHQYFLSDHPIEGFAASAELRQGTRDAIFPLCPEGHHDTSAVVFAREASAAAAVEVLVRGELLDGLRIALLSMTADETAVFLVHGDYGYPMQRTPRDLMMFVKVHSISTQVDLTSQFLPAFLTVPSFVVGAPPQPPTAASNGQQQQQATVLLGYQDEERLLRPQNIFIKHVVPSGATAAASSLPSSTKATTVNNPSSNPFRFPLDSPYVENVPGLGTPKCSEPPRFGMACQCTIIEVHPITQSLSKVWPPSTDAKALYVIGGRQQDLLKESATPKPMPANRVLGSVARPSFFWTLVDQALVTMAPGEFSTFTYQPNAHSGVGSHSSNAAAGVATGGSGSTNTLLAAAVGGPAGGGGGGFSSVASSTSANHALVFKIRLTGFDATPSANEDYCPIPRNSAELLNAMNKLKERGNKLHEARMQLRAASRYEEALRLARAARGYDLNIWCAILCAHAAELRNNNNSSGMGKAESSSMSDKYTGANNTSSLATPPMMTPTNEKQMNFLSSPTTSSSSFSALLTSPVAVDDAEAIAQLLHMEILLEGNLSLQSMDCKEYLRAALHASNAIVLFKLRQWCLTGSSQSPATAAAAVVGGGSSSTSSSVMPSREPSSITAVAEDSPSLALQQQQQRAGTSTSTTINVHRFFFRRAKAKRYLKLFASARKDLMEAQDWMGHVPADSVDWTTINAERTELENAAS